jgi:DNA-binding NarL/FixJ family response regulator
MTMRAAGDEASSTIQVVVTPPVPPPIRVALIEDDRSTRDGLAVLIGGSAGYACADTYRSVEDAVAHLPATGIDVILLDVLLPGVTGSRGVVSVIERCPAAAILMLSAYEEEDLVFESLCNGAIGYLLKRTPPARLLEAIREVHQGGAPMSPEIARKVIAAFRGRVQPRPEATLTEQEKRLLKLLSEGKSYQVCADQLHVAIDTVRNYIRSVYGKLQVHSRSAAVTVALRSRLI